MDELQSIKALETLCLELINVKNSREYVLGKKICRFIREIRQFKFILQLKRFVKNRKIKKIRETFVQENVPKDQWLKQLKIGPKNKKVIVYSCITGGYDDPVEPLFRSTNIEYAMFTDSKKHNVPGWIYLKIPQKIQKFSKHYQNRYIKMHPFELFPDADYACYIDGNVCPVSDLSVYVEYISPIAGIAMHKHSTRDCIYEELKACLALKKGNALQLVNQIDKYRRDGFPESFGMLECNVIVVDLHSEIAKKIFEDWWAEQEKWGSMRDQIALPYVLWKNNIIADDVAMLGKDVYKNSKLIIREHLK
jgi:hypothetical protein